MTGGPSLGKMTCYLLCLVSSPLEVPRVLLGIVCNHTSSGEACMSEFSLMKRLRPLGRGGGGEGEAVLCVCVLSDEKIERI